MKANFTILLLLTSYTLFSQENVGIGTTTPNKSALLEVKSTTKGFLPPRMTASQRDSIESPVAGLMVYCINCGTKGGEPEYYNGTEWVNMIGGTAAPWLKIGDSYQGGIVAYIFQPTDGPSFIVGQIHGLIITPFNLGFNHQGSRWDNGSSFLTGATARALGTGNANTQKILSVQGGGDHAAAICSDLELNGYNDWYLPSKDELHEVMINAFLIGGFDHLNLCWSSSEFLESGEYAWAETVTGTTQQANPKGVVHNIRAMRTF